MLVLDPTPMATTERLPPFTVAVTGDDGAFSWLAKAAAMPDTVEVLPYPVDAVYPLIVMDTLPELYTVVQQFWP
jgi:hypothetical protein